MRSKPAWCRALIILFAGVGICVSQATTSANPSSAGQPAAASTPVANAPDSSDLIEFLNQTITWYRQLEPQQRLATEPSDALVVSDNRRLADQAIRLAFDYARSQVQSVARQNASNDQNAATARYQSLMQLATKLDGGVKQLQGEIQSIRTKLDTAAGKKRTQLQAQLEETQSELDLANARRDAIRSMVDFVSGTSATGLGASGVRAQIEALARSVPLENTSANPAANAEQQKSSATPASSPAGSAVTKAPPSGIWGLTGDLFALSGKIRTLDSIMAQTDALAQTVKDLRTPLISQLKQLSQQGDQLANQADTSGASALEQQKQQLDALTTQFKQLSNSMLPLSKMGVLLQLYKSSLGNWQASLKSEYHADLKALLIRLVILISILAVVIGFSELWKKTIFRYVHDPRRRYQFMLLRRIVMWFLIAIVIAFAFASQLGQVATFAGLITAGVAVALQNVILSIAGYFLLIGRYGIRVGDRVQISGVNGEVVDVGLIRMHVMEMGPGGATGRVVAFSNSIVFQPTTGLFRQIPGTSFGWHEISLTLAPDTDYRLVEERLLKVVEEVYADYREDMERQRRLMERTLNTVPVGDLRPSSRLRLTSSGLEAVIRFPVSLQNAAKIDDRITRELLQAIDKEPKLTLVGSGNSIRLRTDVTEEVAKS